MSGFIIFVVTVLTVIFLIITLECILDHSMSYITTYVDDSDNCIESRLRVVMHDNPKSEIYVINYSKTEEANEILKKLSKDFPKIHIVSQK